MKPMLEVRGLAAGYGPAQVLFDVNLAIGAGEVVTLLGRNGMGKTTTINTIMGIVPARAGEATFQGRPLLGLPSYAVAQAGIGLVPEGRQIFPALSVEENLVATAISRSGRNRWTLARVYELFPALTERRRHMGDQLSGGEQQMLAIGRALLTNPKLLILDEATEGLAPADPHRDMAMPRTAQRRGAGHPDRRQARARARRLGRSPRDPGEGSRGVVGQLRRAESGRGDRAPLSPRLNFVSRRAAGHEITFEPTRAIAAGVIFKQGKAVPNGRQEQNACARQAGNAPAHPTFRPGGNVRIQHSRV
jgi:branched-chain amino acid transport system ATP-binding protein